MKIPEYTPPILDDIAQLLRLRLHGHIPEDQADALALAQANDLGQAYSGCQLYIPKYEGLVLKRRQRDQSIWQAFTGHNHRELALRYKLTVGQIYTILARTRASRSSAMEGGPTA